MTQDQLSAAACQPLPSQHVERHLPSHHVERPLPSQHVERPLPSQHVERPSVDTDSLCHSGLTSSQLSPRGKAPSNAM
ncbi:hypothetical protein ACOMHN_028791 [Nucella lapillus]